MIVTCKDTGKRRESSKLYKAPNGMYFSNEEAYLTWQCIVAQRSKCVDKFMESMGYDSHQKPSTFFFKKLKEWEETYTLAVIYKTMCASQQSFEYACKVKQFQNELRKTQYYCAIVENHINDIYLEEKKKTISEQVSAKREEESDISIEIISDRRKQQTNIGRFLDDDDI